MVDRIIHTIKKLNTIDYLVIGFVVLAIVLLLYSRYSKKSEWITVKLMIGNQDWTWDSELPQYWLVDNLYSGMVSYNSFGEKIAEIVDIQSFDKGAYRRYAELDLRIKGFHDQNKDVYFHDYKPLEIGKPLELTFEKYNVKGLITHITQGQEHLTEKKIQVELLEREPWEASSLSEGMEMRSSSGTLLAKIDKLDSRITSSYKFSDIRGQYIRTYNPQYRDITIDLSIYTYQSNNVDYFVDRAAVKVGDEIWFQFPKTVIRRAIITKI